MKMLLWVLLAGCAIARADEESCKAAREAPSEDAGWHLLTQTRGGTITLLKHLTHKEAEFARARALDLPATVKECRDTEAKIADDKRYWEEQDKADDAIVQAKAFRCPAGETKDKVAGDAEWRAWNHGKRDALNITVTPGRLCGEQRSVAACRLTDGSIKTMGFGAEGCLVSGGPDEAPGEIMKAEVFR